MSIVPDLLTVISRPVRGFAAMRIVNSLPASAVD